MPRRAALPRVAVGHKCSERTAKERNDMFSRAARRAQRPNVHKGGSGMKNAVEIPPKPQVMEMHKGQAC